MPGFSVIPGDSFGNGRPTLVQETARRHRYTFRVFEPLRQILIYAHKCQRPVAEIDQAVIHNRQDEIFLPGKQHWQPIEITFYEVLSDASDLTPSIDFDITGCEAGVLRLRVKSNNLAAELIRKWWAEDTIVLARSVVGSRVKKDATLRLEDGQGDPIWEYNLLGCWPMKISPDALDYADSGICETTVTLRYDKAKEQKPSE